MKQNLSSVYALLERISLLAKAFPGTTTTLSVNAWTAFMIVASVSGGMWLMLSARSSKTEKHGPEPSAPLIDTAEYHGSVSGKTLLEWGMDPCANP